MDLRIRQALIADSRAIARVQVETWRSTYAGIIPDAFLASLDIDARAENWRDWFAAGNSLMFVAENDAGLVGFVSGGMLREPISGYDAELYAIYLLREHQRNGAGRALVEVLAEALQKDGFRGIAVWVLEQNPAVEFYKRLGGFQIAQRLIEIGGIQLEELAFGLEIPLPSLRA